MNINDADFIEKITSVTPSQRQFDILSMGYYNFIHFGLNTFTKKEWGSGKVSPDVFTLKNINTEKWVTDLKSTGSKGIIITAKHHDGFCLFPSKYTDYSIASTVYKDGKGDIVGELASACKKHGMKFGIYLSPWDRHEKTYGTDAYNDYYVNQLTELCTDYGDIFCFWFDGACGEGENGKKQNYDWERYYNIIRSLQPQACISICGPDVRWIGNERGRARKSEFSVVPVACALQESVAAVSQTKEGAAVMALKPKGKEPDIGSREALYGKDICYYPSEMDIPITYFGWFYRPLFKIFITRTVGNLCKCWYTSVGHNATLLINVPPDKNGRLSPKFIGRMQKAKERIELDFKNEVKAKRTDGENTVTLRFKKQKVKTLVLKEDLMHSQRVESFEVFADGKKVFDGFTVGNREICRLKPESCSEIKILFTQSRNEAIIKSIKIYK